MSKYNRFEDFMKSVVVDANKKCLNRYNVTLDELYKVRTPRVMEIINLLIDKGWWVFVAVVVILSLGPIAFGVSLAAFFTTPAGLIVAVLLAGGGIVGMRILYQNKQLPLAIKETGEYYKDYFNNHVNEISYIDNLQGQASDYLIKKAK